MGTSLPPIVQRDPGAFHTVVPQWTVEFRVRGADRRGAGSARLGSRAEWVAVAARRRSAFALGFSSLAAPARAGGIAAVVALVGIDPAHTVSAEVAAPGAARQVRSVLRRQLRLCVRVGRAPGSRSGAVWRRRIEAFYGLLFVGAMVGLVSGVTDLSYLWKSQLPTVGPDIVSRGEVAVALGLGLGLAAGALLALRRSAPSPRTREVRDPRWLERLVAGLDDDAIAVVCRRMDAGEVIPLALTEVARRLAPLAGDFGSHTLVFVVVAEDEIGTHVWSVTAGGSGHPSSESSVAARSGSRRAALHVPGVPGSARRSGRGRRCRDRRSPRRRR